jgi:hypothetical protein
MLAQSHPEAAKALLTRAQSDVHARWRQYEHLAALAPAKNGSPAGAEKTEE